ncbi:dTDP-4-amino-4,6-dideoxygalactose transaminase [Vibrio bivalvicida]|uniref:dTDP-4-amino-4,6-dideoxygalactose transaminase n=1 Tax=Vibrio bivalvicida TaxID=1276888 RepID=A0A177Y5N7_9VIBR|nr:dTDP-4-amino-4,6-dideoxygalactose transaminase [Vibrio bivalvicida]OAJ96181.1 dTDP-4-amino-4,6-dideoxygalactose transaminase [Vibrio bivalvicida]
MIPFSKPTITGQEQEYIEQAIKSGHLSGDGPFTRKCHQWFESSLLCEKVLLTPSCTAALEMAAILIDIQPGDEVIMPSYTFVSTANAFVLRGAKIVFVDIRPDTMNIDESLIETAISNKTKAIVPVHYAGVACEMDAIMEIAERFNLYVVEDAAQGMTATYKGRPLGTIGHIGTYSFHATKNYTSGGEGGLLILNDHDFIQRAEILREKGTNRTQFINGQIDKYSWVDIGGSHLPSEIQAAFLYSQLECSAEIRTNRLSLWRSYYESLSGLEGIEVPCEVEYCEHNGHIFYIKLSDSDLRESLKNALNDCGIQATTHYTPLHETAFANKVSVAYDCKYTSLDSSRLLRLPLFYGMTFQEVEWVVKVVKDWAMKTNG